MDNLDTAIGFAMVMFFLATVVKLISTWIERRRQFYCDMIEEFHQDAIGTLVRLSKHYSREVPTQLFDDLISELNGPTGPEPNDDAGKITERTEISIDEVMRRIETSPLGKEINRMFGTDASLVMSDFKAAFTKADANATKLFRKHKRIRNSLIGLVVALMFNIDAFNLLHLLSADDEYRNQVLQVSVEEVEKYRAELDAKIDKDTTFSEALTAITQRDVPDTNGVGVFSLQASFPYWQGCWQRKDYDTAKRACSSQQRKERMEFTNWFAWLLGISITGLLAGIGSPFWHDVVQALVGLRGNRRPRTAGG